MKNAMKKLNIKEYITPFLKLSLKKKIIVIFVFIILLIVLLTSIQGTNKRNGYIFDKAKKATLSEVVSESGTITPDGMISIYSPTNGTITEIYVENEQLVKQGKELFKVASSATEAEKQTAYANYLTVKATLDADTANLYTLQSTMYSAWKIYKDIATNSTYENSDGTPKISNRVLTEFTTVQDNWLAAEADYKNQQGVIAKDQAALASAYETYKATQTTVVKAPLDGIVSNISIAPGNTVQAKTALTPSAGPVLIIKNSDALEAVVPVGQSNIAKVKTGQQSVIKPDAYKDKNYTGNVVRVDSIGENNQGVVTYSVYIKVNADDFLKPGMTFDCDITTKKLENILTVPNSAVVLESGRKTVRILEGDKLRYIQVLTGIKGETRTQIINGISEDQEIISALTNEKAQRPGLLGL